jgi:hypothetical protein
MFQLRNAIFVIMFSSLILASDNTTSNKVQYIKDLCGKNLFQKYKDLARAIGTHFYII